MTRRYLLYMLCIALVVPACSSDPTSPEERPEERLTFLRLAGTAPPFEAATVSFWAVRGQNREGRIFFLQNGERGEEFARLRIDANSLLAQPNGSPILPGDSILVTMRVIDPLRFQIELLPSGLTFSSSRPARLKLDYEFADEDYDGDGDVDPDDLRFEGQFAIWRQRTPGTPWVRLGTVKLEGRELEADLTGFSRFAIAY